MQLVTHVVGARPNFPKAAPVIEALSSYPCEQRLVHTGQHYDDNMSKVFFTELELPEADVNLGVGSGSHAQQTAAMMTALEQEFLTTSPALVVVYGDVNSTVAAALVTAKLGIALAHVEAGLRSFDMSMPEEVNRVVTDRLSSLLFVTSAEALGHLAAEGIAAERVHFVGNPMIDTLLRHLPEMDAAAAQREIGVSGQYAVATLHRPGNVDSRTSLAGLVRALHDVADQLPVVLPVHPRGAGAMKAAGLFDHPGVLAVDPLPYVRFLSLVRGAVVVMTDSGGLQEETTILGVPCLTLRPNTERPVTTVHGTNRLTRPELIAGQVAEILSSRNSLRPSAAVPPLWDGRSGERIAVLVASHLQGDSGPVRLP
jgi:UDP-N-acetylglucosamine 2-epimerase (non-hydrolysing)